MDNLLLRIENLVTSFTIAGRQVNAIDGISLQVQKGRTLGIVGESGCGKSVTSLSLLRLIPDPPGKIVSGKVLFEDQDLLQISEPEMRKIRGNRISMIFQEPMTSLNPVYTVGDQIAEVFTIHKGATKQEARKLAIEMLRHVHIPAPEKRVDDYPHQLSGGMRQRVMIAIALACKPALLIADEPTTALDVTIQAQILALMNKLQQEEKMSIIFITHDLGVIAETCDDVAVMYAGKIVETGTTKEIFYSPRHPYTIGLLNSIPKLGAKKHRLNTIPGIVPSLGKFPSGCRFRDRCPWAAEECKETDPKLFQIANAHQAACLRIDAVQTELGQHAE